MTLASGRSGAPRQTNGYDCGVFALATARAFGTWPGIAVAMGESELRIRLDSLETLEAPKKIGPYAQPELLAVVKDFITG